MIISIMTNWFLLHSLFILVVVVVRVSPRTCIDPNQSNLTGEHPLSIRFVGVTLTLNCMDLVQISHLRVSPRRSPGKTRLVEGLILLLLSAGDVETNPGPVRYACTSCKKCVKPSDQAVLCDKCDNWTHASCGGVSQSEYLHLEDAGDWFCPSCNLSVLPFADSSTISTGSSLSATDTSGTSSVTDMNSSNPSTVPTHLKCCVYNARSVMNKLCDVAAILETDKPDIVAITETFLGEEIIDSEIVDNAYTVFR